MQNAQLTIIIPNVSASILKDVKSKLSTLALLLNRADIEELSTNSWEMFVCQAFGLDPASELPMAALIGLADGLDTKVGYWLRADPVQLQADLSAVYLAGNEALNLSEQDLTAFRQELNLFFKQDQLKLFTPVANRWYLQSNQPIQLNTFSLKQTFGKNIMNFLPTGIAQVYWRKLLTEIQMLLYSSQTNQLRNNQGLPTINGLWLWGAGQLPTTSKPQWHTIWSDEELLKGLAKNTQMTIEKVPVHAQSVLAQMNDSNNYLITLKSVIQESKEEWLAELETNWLKPLIKALRKKQLNSLALYLGNNKLFYINWKTIWYFWRRNL